MTTSPLYTVIHEAHDRIPAAYPASVTYEDVLDSAQAMAESTTSLVTIHRRGAPGTLAKVLPEKLRRTPEQKAANEAALEVTE